MKEQKQKNYLMELLRTKLCQGNLQKVTESWGRPGKVGRQDILKIQTLYDGIGMYIERMIEGMQ